MPQKPNPHSFLIVATEMKIKEIKRGAH